MFYYNHKRRNVSEASSQHREKSGGHATMIISNLLFCLLSVRFTVYQARRYEISALSIIRE